MAVQVADAAWTAKKFASQELTGDGFFALDEGALVVDAGFVALATLAPVLDVGAYTEDAFCSRAICVRIAAWAALIVAAEFAFRTLTAVSIYQALYALVPVARLVDRILSAFAGLWLALFCHCVAVLFLWAVWVALTIGGAAHTIIAAFTYRAALCACFGFAALIAFIAGTFW